MVVLVGGRALFSPYWERTAFRKSAAEGPGFGELIRCWSEKDPMRLPAG